MEKILVSSLFALLAAVLTAVISFVKLVNDKEGKVSDFRQQWIISVRESIAKLLSKIAALCLVLEERAVRSQNFNSYKEHVLKAKSDNEKELLTVSMEYELSMLEKANTQKSELLREVHEANQLSRLLFKQNDSDFIGIESKIDSILVLLRSTEEREYVFEKVKLKETTGRIDVLCSEILGLTRLALKSEWERVKKGEVVYIKTKTAAKWGGVFFFFVFLTLGIHGYIASHKNDSLRSQSESITQKEAPAEKPISIDVAISCLTSKEAHTKSSGTNKCASDVAGAVKP